MLRSPLRKTWVVAKDDFTFRGVKLEAGSVFRPRTLNPRAWKRFIAAGSIVPKSDFEATKKEEPVVVPEPAPTPVEVVEPVAEVVEEVKKPKKAKPKKKKKDS